ncbi:MAG: BlaI/MecI/CopY family transcriptional regulator [Muribaculaceae bacterium]|nr:BlaI/MecI/CopY family transcriptional regulator [Muribaculaceae bacterium]
MLKGRPKSILTEKEEEIMTRLWEHGPLFVREIVELYPEPRPHFNTVATTVRILEQKGFVGHESISGSHRFYAIASIDECRSRSLGKVIANYFRGSYRDAVSALVAEEKITADDLRELLDIVENKNKSK